MFFLHAFSQISSVTLFVRGTIDKDNNPVFIKGEPIFVVNKNNESQLEVIKQVGVVQVENNQLSFHYTDSEFKQSINYQEKTGYSTMDGGPWIINQATFVNNNEASEKKLSSNLSLPIFMYTSAKKPFSNLRLILSQHLMGNLFFNKNQKKQNDSDDDIDLTPSI